jgi:predicted nucleic acid-binding protein
MLLDTSGLLCVLHQDEEYHEDASTLFAASTHRLIHNYVLAEFVALAHGRGVLRPTVLAFLAAILADPDTKTIWVDENLNARAIALIRARPDKDYSLCDAVSFVLMRDYGIPEALTTDHHFEQEGFVRLLK